MSLLRHLLCLDWNDNVPSAGWPSWVDAVEKVLVDIGES